MCRTASSPSGPKPLRKRKMPHCAPRSGGPCHWIDSGRPRCGLPPSDAALAARRRSAVKAPRKGRFFYCGEGRTSFLPRSGLNFSLRPKGTLFTPSKRGAFQPPILFLPQKENGPLERSKRERARGMEAHRPIRSANGPLDPTWLGESPGQSLPCVKGGATKWAEGLYSFHHLLPGSGSHQSNGTEGSNPPVRLAAASPLYTRGPCKAQIHKHPCANSFDVLN